MRALRAVTAGAIAFAAAPGCSLTTNFDQFTSAPHADGGGALADAATDGGAFCPHDEAEILCTDFSPPDPAAGWNQAITSNRTDVVDLDLGRYASPPSAGRFYVQSGTQRYAELLFNFAAVDRVELRARIYIDAASVADVGQVALISLGPALNQQEAKISLNSVDGLHLAYVESGPPPQIAPMVPAAKVPLRTFMSLRLVRDDAAHLVNVELDGAVVLRDQPIGTAAPGTTNRQLRVGVVYAELTSNAVTIDVDDLSLRKLP